MRTIALEPRPARQLLIRCCPPYGLYRRDEILPPTAQMSLLRGAFVRVRPILQHLLLGLEVSAAVGV